MASNKLSKNDLRNRLTDMKLFAEQGVAELNIFLEEVYAKTTPKPESPNLAPPTVLLMAIVFAIATFLASSVRVYDRFFNVAFSSSDGNAVLSTIESLAAVIAINGVILMAPFGLRLLKKKNGEIVEKESDLKSTESLFKWSLGFGILISFVAGVGQSVVGSSAFNDSDVVGGIDWVLAISLAFITALEYIFGEVIARLLDGYMDDRREKKLAYDKLVKSWTATGKTQFHHWKKRFDRFYGDDGVGDSDDVENLNSKPKSQAPVKKKKSKKNYVKKLADNIYKEKGSVPTFTELMDALVELATSDGILKTDDDVENFKNARKGLVSSSRTEWMDEKGIKDE